jgi:hypothetical protein
MFHKKCHQWLLRTRNHSHVIIQHNCTCNAEQLIVHNKVVIKKKKNVPSSAIAKINFVNSVNCVICDTQPSESTIFNFVKRLPCNLYFFSQILGVIALSM